MTTVSKDSEYDLLEDQLVKQRDDSNADDGDLLLGDEADHFEAGQRGHTGVTCGLGISANYLRISFKITQSRPVRNLGCEVWDLGRN